MPSKKQTTVVLAKEIQKIKTELAGVYGLKNLLSAAILHFSRETDSKQKALIKEIHHFDEQEDAADMHSAVQSILRVMTGAQTEIKILPDEENKIVDFIYKTLGPKEQILHQLKQRKA
jgi:hypothetical protein